MSEKSCDIVDMEDWIKDPGADGECRPCLLGPVVQWYTETLEEKGHADLAEGLVGLTDKPDVTPQEVCQKLDSIKQEVDQETRDRLLDFDCSAQLYHELETRKEG